MFVIYKYGIYVHKLIYTYFKYIHSFRKSKQILLNYPQVLYPHVSLSYHISSLPSRGYAALVAELWIESILDAVKVLLSLPLPSSSFNIAPLVVRAFKRTVMKLGTSHAYKLLCYFLQGSSALRRDDILGIGA